MFKGLLLSISIGILGLILANYFPIGAVALAIIIGIIVANLIKLDSSYNILLFNVINIITQSIN